ncbi:hypothetical protein HY212_02320 [Candidatus Pacearchaeota archaeon]|nr:hypothetical protein [Candidatus Pacearchaeota archaeon]
MLADQVDAPDFSLWVVHNGILFRYKIYHAEISNARAIKKTNRITGSCRLYDINGKLVL